MTNMYFADEIWEALEADGEKLRQLTGQDHGPWCAADLYPGQAPCPSCFESSGYIWEHGNDRNTGPWSVQTTIQCKHCNGTGTVDAPLATMDDLENLSADEDEARRARDISRNRRDAP